MANRAARRSVIGMNLETTMECRRRETNILPHSKLDGTRLTHEQAMHTEFITGFAASC